MALFLALTLCHHLLDGFRNHDLRQHVADLLGVSVAEYTSNYMTYDLRRLRLKGLILPTAQNQPLRCHALRLEGRTALLPPGCPHIPARHGDVHRQRRRSTVSASICRDSSTTQHHQPRYKRTDHV
jgi:hypothetical protein